MALRLIAFLWSLLIAAHTDQRGNIFTDLLGNIGGGVREVAGWVRDRLREMQDAMWQRLGHLGSTIWDAAGRIIDPMWERLGHLGSTIWDSAGRIESNLWQRMGHLGATVWDAAGRIIDPLWERIGQLGGTIWDAARDAANKLFAVVSHLGAVITDALHTLANKIWEVLANGFSLLAGSVEHAATSVDDLAAAAKDLPDDIRDRMADVFERVVGLGGSFMDDWIDLAERYLRGDVASIEELLGLAHEKAPQSSILDNTVYFFSFFTFILVAVQEVAGVRAESIVQRFRAENPTALLDPEDIRDAMLRGIGNPERHIASLRKAGFSDVDIDTIRQLWQELPPPSDLIRMAVREVFSPDVVERFGQLQDFPQQFAFLAAQQGVSEDFARFYWAAHWELPSAEQMFEMFHRGLIDFGTLQIGLRALDVMPFWRDKLTDLAYNTVTRVDTRRLFQSGVWDRERVRREYLNQGYRPEDAEALTLWTTQEYGDSGVGPRDLTRSAVEKAYRQGRINRDEAIEELVDMGYGEDEAAFFVANVDVDIEDDNFRAANAEVRDITQSVVLGAYRDGLLGQAETEAFLFDLGYQQEGVDLLIAVQDFRNEQEITSLRLKALEQEFRRGIVSADQAESQMLGLGLNAERAAATRRKWELQYAERTRDLTEAQLGRALTEGIIDDTTYVTRVIGMGYTTEDAAVLLQLRVGRDEATARALSLSSIRTAYRRGVITRPAAMDRLIAAGFSGEDADIELRLVDQSIEADAQAKADREARAAAAEIRELSQGTILGAYKRGIITRAETIARLVALGYRDEDAQLAVTNVDVDLARSATS